MTDKAPMSCVVVTIAAATILPAASASPFYNVTELVPIYGPYTTATSINAAGDVIGFSWIPATAGNQHIFIYKNSMITDLGTPWGYDMTIVGQINDAGQIAGGGRTPDGTNHAFLYADGIYTDLGTVPGDRFSWATSINNSGQITGSSGGDRGPRAFLYSNGTMTDIGSLGGNQNIPASINNSGYVTGWSNLDGYSGQHAYLYASGIMKDLGTLGGGASQGSAINDKGQVVGTSDVSGGGSHAFLYQNGVMTDLGPIGGQTSSGLAINNLGQIVGYFTVNSVDHAFLLTDGVAIDLNLTIDPALNIQLRTATAINDAGQIVANGTSANGAFRGYLLTPVTTVVPEPSSLTLFIVAGLVTGVYRHRRRQV